MRARVRGGAHVAAYESQSGCSSLTHATSSLFSEMCVWTRRSCSFATRRDDGDGRGRAVGDGGVRGGVERLGHERQEALRLRERRVCLLHVVRGRVAVHVDLADEGALPRGGGGIGEEQRRVRVDRGEVDAGGRAERERAAHHIGIDALGVLQVVELSLKLERVRLEPLQQLQVVARAREGELRRVRVCVD
eukprot:1506220-Pleurochrysis_carterae.AAC.2